MNYRSPTLGGQHYQYGQYQAITVSRIAHLSQSVLLALTFSRLTYFSGSLRLVRFK